MEGSRQLSLDSLARIAMVARVLTQGLSPDEIVDIVVHQELADLQADGAVIAVLDGDVLSPVAALGTSGDALRRVGVLTFDRSVPLVAAVLEQAPVYVPNRRDAETRFPDLAAAAGASEAWAALPLIANGTSIGVMGVSFQREHGFSETERLFLGTLANLTALALAAQPAGLQAHRAGSDASDAVEVVLLDRAGMIVEANAAWSRFCEANGGDLVVCGIGVSYLAVCDRAGAEPAAVEMGRAIRQVLAGEVSEAGRFRFDCDGPGMRRWFDATVTARVSGGHLVGARVTFVPVGLDGLEPALAVDGTAGTGGLRWVGAPAVGRVAAQPFDDEPHGAVLPLLVASVADLLDATGCAVSLTSGSGARRVVGTADAFERIDAAQSASGAGPGVQACRTVEVVAVDDVAARALDWPVYVAAARSEGIRAVLAAPLGTTHPPPGVLVVYDARVRVWTSSDIVIVEAFARLGAAYLTISRHLEESERAREESERSANGLQHALSNNAVIEQAKGMLAAEQHIPMARAFELLRRHARANRASVRDVAESVVNLRLRPAGGEEQVARVVALALINDLFRVGLALAPLTADDSDIGAFAREVMASADGLIADVRLAAVRRAGSEVEVADRAASLLARVGRELAAAAVRMSDAGDDDVRAALVRDAREVVRQLPPRHPADGQQSAST